SNSPSRTRIPPESPPQESQEQSPDNDIQPTSEAEEQQTSSEDYLLQFPLSLQQSPPRRSSSSSSRSPSPKKSSESKGIPIPKQKFNPLDVPTHHPEVDSPLRKTLPDKQQRPLPPFLSSGKSPDPSPTNSPPQQKLPLPPPPKKPTPPPPSHQLPSPPPPPRATLNQPSTSATEEPPQASPLTLLRNDVVVSGLLIFAFGYAVSYLIHGRK
ncbi:hypothetical protein L195_g013327, partial [Trifolium pratense]